MKLSIREYIIIYCNNYNCFVQLEALQTLVLRVFHAAEGVNPMRAW